LYQEAGESGSNVGLYASVPQDPATIQAIARMSDLTLEAQRSRNRAQGISNTYVPSQDVKFEPPPPGWDQGYADPRSEPMIRGRGPAAAPIPSAYALPKPLINSGTPPATSTGSSAGTTAANPYALPRSLLPRDEPADDPYMLPRPLMNDSFEAGSPSGADTYAVPTKPRMPTAPELPARSLSSTSSAGSPGGGSDVYAMPTRTMLRSVDSVAPPQPAVGPALPPRQASASSQLGTSPHSGMVAPPLAPRRSLSLPTAVVLHGNETSAQFLNQTFHRVDSVIFADRCVRARVCLCACACVCVCLSVFVSV
jgi:hypothetical protein